MPESLHRGGNIDLVRGEEQEIASDEFHETVENHRTDDTDTDRIEGHDAFVHQDLVHHDLEKQRHDQRKERDDADRQRDLAEDPFQFQEFGNEPAETERLIFIGQPVGLFQQETLAAVDLPELCLIHEVEPVSGSLVFRIDHRDFHDFILIRTDAAEQDLFPVLFDADRRIGIAELEQTFPVEIPLFDLEFVIGSDLVKQGIAGLIFTDGVIMHDAADVHVDTVMFGDIAETEQRTLFGGIDLLQIPENDDRTAKPAAEFLTSDPERTRRLTGNRFDHDGIFFAGLTDILDQDPFPVRQPDQGRTGILLGCLIQCFQLDRLQFLIIGQPHQHLELAFLRIEILGNISRQECIEIHFPPNLRK